jgi:Ser/Thr protein kinase RdoA (MazF antagonist)
MDPMGSAGPPREAENWCAELVELDTFRELPARRPGQVFAVDGVDFSGILKIAGSSAAFEAELHSYQYWSPALPGETARLVGASPGLRAILLSRLPGRPCSKPTLAACWHAGHLLARMQAAVPPRPCAHGSFADVVAQDLAHWLAAGADVLSARESAIGAEAAASLAAFDHASLVPCHGDFVPRNWLVTDDGQWVGLIDFEHSRYDAAEADLAILWDGELAELPDHRAVLLTGYGDLDGVGRRRLTTLRIVAALARVVGGSHARDERVELVGRRALSSLMAA